MEGKEVKMIQSCANCMNDKPFLGGNCGDCINFSKKEWHFTDSIVRDVIAWKEIVLPKED